MSSLPSPFAIHILRATETSSRVQWFKTFSSILDGENGLEAAFRIPLGVVGYYSCQIYPCEYRCLLCIESGVRMLPAGSGMGVMCGMTRGIKMARPPSSSIMNSTTGLLTSSTPTPTPAQGNSMLRSREAMHMIRCKELNRSFPTNKFSKIPPWTR
ncbi:unnamed protein product [Lactuca saligna]|uniref:Uncharacterized protein n=1 Tax=Lactuca saligna TaxID=75948 RepID=A0AA35Y345_LACSI|nr:unnamed protein product [Lactuca saligna]